MKTLSLKLALAAALLCTSIGAQATTVFVGGCPGGASVLTTCDLGATVIDFDSGVMPATITTESGSGGRVVSGGLAGQYAAPLDDTTPFLAVPATSSDGAVTVFLGGTYNYFGIYWGSIDSFNSVTFYNNGVSEGSFSGSDVLRDSALEGNQITPGSNEYINFAFGAAAFNSVVIASTNYAFEMDNLAFAHDVPAPTGAGMLGLALLGLGAGVRRRRSTLPVGAVA